MVERSHRNQELLLLLDQFIGGVLGGFSQVIVGQPFDTVKVRLQASNQYTSIMDCIGRMYTNEGIGSFFKGTLSPLVGTGLLVSIEMGCNEIFKSLMRKEHDQRLSYWQIFMSGMLAGFVGTSISTPVEHGKIRMQLQMHGGQYKGSMNALQQIYHQYGIKGVYNGFTITLSRQVVPSGLYYLTYQYVKRQLKTKGKIYFREIFPAGALAGLSYWLISYPLDLIKTRVQHDSLEHPQYAGLKGIQRAWRQIKSEGWRKHISGFNMCMIRSMPVYGLNFYVYEKVIRILSKAEHLSIVYE